MILQRMSDDKGSPNISFSFSFFPIDHAPLHAVKHEFFTHSFLFVIILSWQVVLRLILSSIIY